MNQLTTFVSGLKGRHNLCRGREAPVASVLAENLEVDASTGTDARSERQIQLLGTREQCLLLQNAAKHQTTSLRTRKSNDEKLQFPDGINREAFKELDAAARSSDLEPTVE